jgi:hypothetical protein
MSDQEIAKSIGELAASLTVPEAIFLGFGMIAAAIILHGIFS